MYALSKYIDRYCEPHTQDHAAKVKDAYDHVLVIPAYDESATRLNQLTSFCEKHNALLILVVNAPDDAPIANIDATQDLLTLCQGPNTLIIDHVNAPLSPRMGVGLARKIGSDIAAVLVHSGKVRDPWLYQTDADVSLPNNYFQSSKPKSGTVVFGYHHRAVDERLAQAIKLYEAHLDHYVAGLRYAGSKYAYPSLGSTLAIHAASYAGVRGYPKRNAGEDFHILNKLAKIGPVLQEHGVTLEIDARVSHRVPFGTGPALAKILESTDLQGPDSYSSYHPQVFEALKDTLSELNAFADNPGSATFSPTTANALSALGWQKVEVVMGDAEKSQVQRHTAIHDWFDALRTLRFIHLNQALYPDQPLTVARSQTAAKRK